jgi:hypothetical protein
MSHQFKAGDLALIVGGPCAGCAVELISFHQSGDVRLNNGCLCEAETPSWRVAGSGLTAKIGTFPGRYPVRDGLISPGLLMPLRGDFAPEQTKSIEVTA